MNRRNIFFDCIEEKILLLYNMDIILVLMFSHSLGTCYLVPLLGGWLADTYLGRFNTIYGSSLLYVVGTLLLAVVSLKNDMLKELLGKNAAHDKAARLVYFVLALVMIAFGTGGIKANVSPFGADQVQQDGPRAIQAFFNWFYWFINIGSLIAFTVVVWIQQCKFFYGYAITAGTMFLAVLAFLAGRNKYLTKPPGGSQLTEITKILCEARRNRKQNTGGWLDGAKSTFGGKFTRAQVEDVKSLLRVIAVFFLFILYWTIYFQVSFGVRFLLIPSRLGVARIYCLSQVHTKNIIEEFLAIQYLLSCPVPALPYIELLYEALLTF